MTRAYVTNNNNNNNIGSMNVFKYYSRIEFNLISYSSLSCMLYVKKIIIRKTLILKSIVN